MAADRAALKHLGPAWYAVVMGLAGLSLAWHAAVPLLGDGAGAAALVIGALAALVFAGLAAASLWRLRRHPEAWAEDLKHPVRHVFVAALPIALILLVSSAVAAGLRGPLLETLWWAASLAQLSVTAWVLSRWWRGPQAGGASWAGVTPALFVPIVGNVLVPLAGVPLGRAEWAAAQSGVGLLFWPVVLVLLLVRVANQGPWPERLLPSNFIVIAPPAAAGLAALRFELAPAAVWALWGVALFSLLWAAPLLRRIAALPFGIAHWGMSFPLAAFTALSLRLAPPGPMSLAGLALLAFTSLLIAALALATWRGLRDGSLLAPETVPIGAASGPTAA
ncbi:MAG: C4-dicarboxylate ABC transporter [Burkholderiaceae bacterium]|nr:C4-dicarboxylate ABC transporter [Burkholderiaceae bacterium]